ncbi:MAG: phosphoribosylamine--glycine ligase [Acidimicrobiia bacterium]|nr:MAG: phosphoribosylamine--glycine ligase [Acidimicrobiia bacterium]
MRVLLIGGGGREHAIGWKLSQSPILDRLVSCPGNPGLETLGDVVDDVDPENPAAIVALCKERAIDLVVVGPEGPLAAGVADELIAERISVFGPTRAGTRLESSKSFAKEIMVAAGVPTAGSATFQDREAAVIHLEKSPGPYVVKADGLAAGKGVLVTESLEAATHWVDECLGGRIGATGSSVVIEDHLVGDEVSIIYVCANGEAIPFQPARDYKRLLEDDQGPNTGGMGCFSPVEDVDEDLVDWTTARVTLPTLGELESRGIAYTGFLYVGLMLTSSGPKVLEFNCRLGDPETEVLMPRICSDLLVVLNAAANGALTGQHITWTERVAVDVVLAAPGYPESPLKGLEISGLESLQDVIVFHAGTRMTNKGLMTSGGRVLNVVGIGDTVGEARRNAYAGVHQIDFEGKQYRTDIAAERKGTSP